MASPKPGAGRPAPRSVRNSDRPPARHRHFTTVPPVAGPVTSVRAPPSRPRSRSPGSSASSAVTSRTGPPRPATSAAASPAPPGRACSAVTASTGAQGIGTEPVDGALDVDVQQRVAEDDDGAGRGPRGAHRRVPASAAEAGSTSRVLALCSRSGTVVGDSRW